MRPSLAGEETSPLRKPKHPNIIIVKFRINWALRTSAVGKPHLPGEKSVHLFLGSTISENTELHLTPSRGEKGENVTQPRDGGDC